MRKTTAAGLLLVGAMGLGAGAYRHETRFGAEEIWARQRPAIEYKLRHEPQAKANAYKALRGGLVEAGSDAERACKAELVFSSRLGNKTDADAAEEISRRSFTPFYECTPAGRIEEAATRWYSVVGAVLFVTGLLGMALSFGKDMAQRIRNRNTPPQTST